MFRNCYEINLSKFFCKLTSVPRDFNQNQVCLLCQKLFTNVFAHASCICLARANIRDLCWIDIVNLFDIRLSAELCALTDDDLFLVILGQQTLTQLGSSEYTSFRMLQTSEQHRSSIQQSDISYLNKQCDHYKTIYQYIYIFDIYVFIHP